MVPAETVIVPSGFIEIEPAIGVGAVPGVSVTSEGTTAIPFSVSLSRTLSGVVAPSNPFIEAGVSSTATMGAASTTTVAFVVAQFVGFSSSQIVYS